MDILKYKGYEGTVDVDVSLAVCRGKILFIGDLVTYQSKEIGRIQAEFEAAVDDYLETCKDLGGEPQVALKGQFNVRVSPSLHKALSLRAVSEGTSLNEIVSRACNAFVCNNINHTHNHNVTFNAETEPLPGVIFGVKSVSLSHAKNDGPTAVDASAIAAAAPLPDAPTETAPRARKARAKKA